MALVPIKHRYNATAGTVPLAANLPVRELAINTGDGKVYTKTDAGAVIEIGEPPTKSVTISGAPTASENILLFFAHRALKVTDIRALVKGTSPSVTFKINYGTDASAAGTAVVTAGNTVTNTTTGTSITTFNSATIAAGSWVWLTTSAVSGTVTAFHVTLVFE